MDAAKAATPTADWYSDPYWRNRRLSPAQIQVHDVRLDDRRYESGSVLGMHEILSSSLLPQLENRDRLANNIPLDDATKSVRAHFQKLAFEFGWMNCLRGDEVQTSASDPPELRKCRWIHISSKYSDYLSGCLLALSDWSQNHQAVVAALHRLEHCVSQQERFSKHGRYFAPFFQSLSDDCISRIEPNEGPMLLSVPFLDWAVEGEPPPLRFQVDPREGFQSSRSSSHMLRSILQHFYRLEDTTDRESQQVFTRHKPWLTDRNLDLKVRRWYGHYPTSLNVDELWILVIDARHVVTFSSNQSWKARWPPLQLSARIAEISFRGIRNAYINTAGEHDYTATTHIVTALNGALGMLHRSFWSDITLCLSDRFASYLGHLQYRLHRAPSTKLVMDLLQVQEELNIVISIMEQQMEVVSNLQGHLKLERTKRQRYYSTPPNSKTSTQSIPPVGASTYRQLSFSNHLSDPFAQLLDNLEREHADLIDLRENSNALINRTIQLVNIRLEDHGKAILVFTIVTIIFLPLSFISSFFGMNFSDIRDMERTQRLFWLVAGCLTVATVGFSLFFAFYGGSIMDWVVTWKETRSRRLRTKAVMGRATTFNRRSEMQSFEVLGPPRNDGF
ncbi:mg2+ transporter [Stagonosporopsis vannaccii]|nr:mg2+ transporter [Stagonosporopsis vannaccii]